MLGLPPAFVLSQDQTLKLKPPIGRFLTANLCTYLIHVSMDRHICLPFLVNHEFRQTVKLTTLIIGSPLECDTRSVRSRLRNQTARISLQIASMSKSRGKNKTEPPFPWRFRPYHLDRLPLSTNRRRFRFVSHRSASRRNHRRFGEGSSTDLERGPQPPFAKNLKLFPNTPTNPQ